MGRVGERQGGVGERLGRGLGRGWGRVGEGLGRVWLSFVPGFLQNPINLRFIPSKHERFPPSPSHTLALSRPRARSSPVPRPNSVTKAYDRRQALVILFTPRALASDSAMAIKRFRQSKGRKQTPFKLHKALVPVVAKIITETIPRTTSGR